MSIGVDINTDRVFQERFWIAVRLGWLAMAAVLLAAIFGFTGSGGRFSNQTLSVGASEVELPSVSRWASADTLIVTVARPNPRTTVLIPAPFGDVFAIESVNPEPTSVSASAKGDTFVFDLQPGPGKPSIDFAIRANRPAWRRALGRFEVNGQSSRPALLTVLP